MKSDVMKLVKTIENIAIMLIATTTALVAAPIRTLPNLQSITIHETGVITTPNTYTPNAIQLTTRLADPLTDTNRDFTFYPNEDYDVFYSNEDGTLNIDGEYLTIEGVWPDSGIGGGMNINEVELTFGGVSPYSQFGDFVASYVFGSICPTDPNMCITGSEATSVDHNLNTFPRFGQTSSTDPDERFRITIGFNGISGVKSAWQAVNPVNTARNEFAAGVVDNKIYIFGGVPGTGINLKSTEMLDLANPVAWTTLADNNHNNGIGVEGITGSSSNGKFYVFGASDGDLTFNFVEEYDPDTNSWRSLAPMRTARSQPTALTYNNIIYTFGGIRELKNKDVYSTVVEAYTPADNSWRKETAMPNLRILPAYAAVGDKAYIIGGGLASTWKVYNSIYRYDFNNKKWKTSGFTGLPTPRIFSYGHAAPVLNGKIYLVAGATIGKRPNIIPSKKVEIFDPLSNTWQIGPELPQASLFGATVVAGNAIYVISGKTTNDDSSLVNNVWKLTDAWKSTLTTQETCDLNADGKYSATDATLFTNACKSKTAYWQCDLNGDGKFNTKDKTAYKLLWKKATKSCPAAV